LCSSKLCGSLYCARTKERARERFVVAYTVFVYMKYLFVLYNKFVRLQRANYAVYANAHSRINSLYHFSLYKNICLFCKTS
jgi:hypothetical protein